MRLECQWKLGNLVAERHICSLRSYLHQSIVLTSLTDDASGPNAGKHMSTVSFEKDGAVGVVTLSKPPHNLIEDALITDMLSAYSQAVEQGCRSILLRSAMRHFCAGADVDGFCGRRAAARSGRVRSVARLA